ncbi:polysaccharide biosynthesis/export family protein [Fulvivirga sp. 29W222]|uniref:Polysaccharide biosynthesis/export family protein n=1 Tax=Fulvivirga marina TaxID=2494733 RepID=A0A937FV67_9BACT|nr:polysaccharide biosynthesis/export family protein [Fulvivirga marina]MBL6444831.1 polysaccharide biosynthesis/export family protein [Fulvivirga marina]
MKNNYLYLVIVCLFFSACSSYKQNIMFKKGDSSNISKIEQEKQQAESNYIININDYLELQVFTKSGEKLIDPEFALSTGEARLNEQNARPKLNYLVKQDGFVKLPMIGEAKLQGMTIKEAEEILQEKYATFYKDPFVSLRYLNKRVIVLGAIGGHVIPLENENIKVTEVLALSEGIDNNSKVQNIRLLRGDEAYFIDLSTIEGYRQSNMIVRSGDIIYVEPIRRPFTEFMRENGPVISVLSSMASLIAVLISIQ